MVFPKFQWSSRITLVFLLGVIVIINLSFGLPRIARFSAVDEHLWTYDRVPRFWRAIEKGDWRKTDINDKPGITIALVSGVGLLFSDPVSHELSRTAEKDVATLDQVYHIDTSFRLPVYVFSLCMIPVFFFLVWRLFEDRWIALFSTAFTFLSPILLGISLIVNPDSLLWLFFPFSLMSFLIFLKKGAFGYAFLSGFFLGLALLTKYVATILFPFFLLSIFLTRIFPIQKQSTASVNSTDRAPHKEVLRTGLLGFFAMILSSFATITIFYPAVWVSFSILLQTTFLSRPMASVWPFFLAGILGILVEVFFLRAYISSRVVYILFQYRNLCGAMVASLFLVAMLFVFANVYMGMQWIDFPSLLAVPKASGAWSVSDLFAGALTGLYGLVFGITPVVLAFFISAVASLIFIKESASYRNEKHQSIMLILLIFISIYYLASAVNFVDATVRYQISLYPLASIIAAIGVSQCYKWTRARFRADISVIAIVIIIVCSCGSLLLIRPYFFSYASLLLPRQYVLNMKDMGNGSYEASQYLNALPEAERLSIWTDKVAVCEHFVGRCSYSIKQKNLQDQYFDYFVLSFGRRQKSLGFTNLRQVTDPDFLRAMTFYDSDNFEGYQIFIGGRTANSIKIIRNNSISSDDL